MIPLPAVTHLRDRGEYVARQRKATLRFVVLSQAGEPDRAPDRSLLRANPNN